MSDTLPRNSENPDALPVNERSSAFIDSAAFLNFVRLKSLVASQVGSGAIGGDEALNAPSAEEHNAFAHPTTNSAIEAEIEPEDWDSLFGAIEERLRAPLTRWIQPRHRFRRETSSHTSSQWCLTA